MRVAIIGGGLGGLCAARALVAAGIDAHVLEAGARPGGVVGTSEIDGFVREHAASSFLGGPSRGALALCGELGVPRDTALAGMVTAAPDVGALRECEVDFFGRRVVFVNGFAANDPVATERIWNLALARHRERETKLMVINCRLDRSDRSLQLGLALPRWSPADHYFLVGTGTFALARTAVRAGLPAHRLTPLEGETPASVFEEIVGAAGRSALVLGAGNIAGIGLELSSYFEHRSRPGADEHAA